MLRSTGFVLLLLCVLPIAQASAQIGTTRIATGLVEPTYLTAPAGDFDRLFVTELGGDVLILDAATGSVLPTPFLTLPSAGILASMAFHPDYASNGFFYVYYRDSSVMHLVRYQASVGDPDLADPGSAQPVLNIPTSGHFGGWMGFGPDGLLYLQVGDGGTFNGHDAAGNSQSVTGELLGNILRIDVDADDFPADPNRNYAIPPDNPYVGIAGEDEVWASGFRNPWRGSFDRKTGDYYFGDVGQDTLEELDFERAGSPGGRNYGWRLREGSIATPTGGVGGPQPPGGVDPIYEYGHGSGASEGSSITGGYVYRGPIRELRGQYFFADFINPRIWSLRVDPQTEVVSDFTDWTSTFAPDAGSFDSIVSFGEDARGNLYIVDHDGEVFRVVGPTLVPVSSPAGLVLIASLLALVGGRLLGARS